MAVENESNVEVKRNTILMSFFDDNAIIHISALLIINLVFINPHSFIYYSHIQVFNKFLTYSCFSTFFDSTVQLIHSRTN